MSFFTTEAQRHTEAHRGLSLCSSVVLCASVVILILTNSACHKKATRVRAPQLPSSAAAATPAVPGDIEYGYASWYGNPYHGRRTSNGETYDMYTMTAAHRTLPFGTEVQVTNMENGKSVHVRINDRGPFVDGRVIDLSLAAAKEIALVGPGTALVQVKVVAAPPAAPVAASPGVTLPGRYTVQVGAFGNPRNAERFRDTLAQRYPQFPINTAPSADGALYRVWVGNEPSEQSASAIADRLKRDRLSAFVIRLD